MEILKKDISEINEEKIVDQIRSIGIDMINEAGSGHPGVVLGAAPILYTLYAHHLKIDPKNPNFFNRDRFILSAGHASALLYSTLYMAGYDIDIEDLKQFRHINSKTPGHPELNKTPGVDMTTGLLGQGFASAVGIAIAEANLRTYFNKDKNNIIDFNTYVFCSDGDLMEGVSYEAASLAGTLKLNKLIVLYDSNNITIEGDTKNTFNDNIPMRFISQGWNVISVSNGEDIQMINKAIEDAKKETEKPTLIEIKTKIGKYSKYEGTNIIHSSKLEKEDISEIKNKMKIRDIPFTVSKETTLDFQDLINDRCNDISLKWEEEINNLSVQDRKVLEYYMGNEKNLDFKEIEYDLPEDNIESTRDTSSKILNSLLKDNPYILGGSADLSKSTGTFIKESSIFSKDNYLGKNILFGVREHAMASIVNGISLCGFRSYAATFLAFSDYMRPAIRMACQMNLPVTYIFSHDSISIGEDGMTHQPVEQLASLRDIPNLEVFRPADANEVIGTYKAILEKKDSPSVISLSKTNIPILETTKANEVAKGGYIVYDSERKLSGIIIATGEEVYYAIEVAKRLKTKGMDIRVVSMPCIKRFKEQDKEYIENVLPVEIRKIVIEKATSSSWNSLVFNDKYLITLDKYGKSGTKEEIEKEYGFDIDSLEEKIENLLK